MPLLAPPSLVSRRNGGSGCASGGDCHRLVGGARYRPIVRSWLGRAYLDGDCSDFRDDDRFGRVGNAAVKPTCRPWRYSCGYHLRLYRRPPNTFGIRWPGVRPDYRPSAHRPIWRWLRRHLSLALRRGRDCHRNQGSGGRWLGASPHRTARRRRTAGQSPEAFSPMDLRPRLLDFSARPWSSRSSGRGSSTRSIQGGRNSNRAGRWTGRAGSVLTIPTLVIPPCMRRGPARELHLYLNEVDRMLERAREVTRNGKYTYIDAELGGRITRPSSKSGRHWCGSSKRCSADTGRNRTNG